MIERIESLVFLHKTVSFGKLEISPATAGPISSLPKSPLFKSPCFRASVVNFSHSAGRNNMVTGNTRAFEVYKAQSMNSLRDYLAINDPRILRRSHYSD
ncbi:MAG: hypothetical protein ABIH24_03760 [Verrucomicrobiota bacterium]